MTNEELINQFSQELRNKNGLPLIVIYTIETKIDQNKFHQDLRLTITNFAERPDLKSEIKKLMQEYIKKN